MERSRGYGRKERMEKKLNDKPTRELPRNDKGRSAAYRGRKFIKIVRLFSKLVEKHRLMAERAGKSSDR